MEVPYIRSSDKAIETEPSLFLTLLIITLQDFQQSLILGVARVTVKIPQKNSTLI
jgi:hypothetical protein